MSVIADILSWACLLSGAFFVGFDSSAGTVVQSNVTGGQSGASYTRPTPLSGSWTFFVTFWKPAFCSPSPWPCLSPGS